MTLLLVGGVVYVLHRHPATVAPVMGGGMVVAVVISCVAIIISAR
ncbi:hypothetical protein OS965_42125 [Streptomyces sp. H27-G5]|nr:hypothetical protein [Streptomyces sp. H27-G5]MCY0924587.1 hypothetical protein [Streptomyces sp. H27-G5]